ncbi:probable ADP-ribosylation factor GTPase-activating protein AGD14 isoform X2 [Punica granatum]|nr:probable ADP-ribosylation factor GTPase-activating protein AGD14 isoform X2 [Punica granatum]
MANRKEDEKNERIIRGLLKLPENRRCINCNSLGPQYVCTSFWTFVCTTCSGIHREFTHRVKSVSMAKFTSQEVSSLQAGGNQRAKEIYFKEWDPQRAVPDSNNVERLRDFIKHAYVDRRFTGDRGSDRPLRAKTGDRDDSYQGGSRSPPYEDVYDRRYSDRSSSGGRSPAYDQESRQYNDYKKSPGRPEVINDWRREDRFGNGRKFDDRRISDGESRVGGSPERPKDLDTSSPPVVRPVREILGENVVPLRIAEPPKANGTRADPQAQTQRTASSSSLGSTSGSAAEVKLESSASLIDFDANPGPPAVAPPQAQRAVQATPQPTSSTTDNNWASFDAVPEVKVSQPPPCVNALDILSQLSVPASAPAPAQHSVGAIPPSSSPILPIVGGSTVPPVGNSSTVQLTPGFTTVMPSSGLSNFAQGSGSTIVPGANPLLPPNGGISYGMQPQQPSLFPVSGVHSTHQSTIHVSGAPHSQPWNVSVAPNPQGPLTSVPSQAPVSKPSDVVDGAMSQNPLAEIKSSARRELPADLFTASYSLYPARVPMWQAGPPYGYGYNMPYNPAMVSLQPQPMPTYPPASKSVNPFDVKEPSPAQASTFPSMASLGGALPNVPPSPALLHAPAAGVPAASWTPPQPSSYLPSVPSQAPNYTSTLPPGAYMGQQMPGSMPPPR